MASQELRPRSLDIAPGRAQRPRRMSVDAACACVAVPISASSEYVMDISRGSLRSLKSDPQPATDMLCALGVRPNDIDSIMARLAAASSSSSTPSRESSSRSSSAPEPPDAPPTPQARSVVGGGPRLEALIETDQETMDPSVSSRALPRASSSQLDHAVHRAGRSAPRLAWRICGCLRAAAS